MCYLVSYSTRYIYIIDDEISAGKGPAFILGKVPTETEEHYDRSFGNPSDIEFDDPDQGSMRTTSSHMYTPTSYLDEMIEKFKEGDKILDGKKSKKSAS